MFTTPGRMCRIMIRIFDAPATRASETYSRVFNESVSARTSRTGPGQEIRAKTPISVHNPCPSTSTTTRMMSNPGKMFHASTIRMTTSSMMPPKYPATNPMAGTDNHSGADRRKDD